MFFVHDVLTSIFIYSEAVILEHFFRHVLEQFFLPVSEQ